jgi:hypothetical protein
MKFNIRFRIGNRWGKASRYSLREFCVYIVDKCSFTDAECVKVVKLNIGESMTADDVRVTRVA